MELPLLTHSSVRTYKTCKRKFYIAYEHRIRAIQESLALRFGTAIHRAVELLATEGIDEAVAYVRTTHGQWQDMFTEYTLESLLVGYSEHYCEHHLTFDFLATEQVFHLEIVNPETSKPSRTFGQGGKIDSIVKLPDGRVAIHEIKTTSENPSDEKYWRRILIDPQVTMYYLAARELGHNVQTIIYDVIRKPAMQPATATPIEKRKYTKDGRLYAAQREADESPQEWGTRLLEDIRSRPEFYYARREIPRIEADLNQSRYELWDVAKDVHQSRLTNRWYRNVGRFTCDYCDYEPICIGEVPWDFVGIPEGFVRLDVTHPELERENNGSTNEAATGTAVGEQRGRENITSESEGAVAGGCS